MYQRTITRMSRSAVVIAIDGSVSMQEWTMLYNTRMRKMEAAALIANFAIDELVMRSTRAGDIRDYYDIAVFRYSDDGIEPIIASEDNSMVHINSLHEAIPQPVCYNIVHEEEDGTQSIIPITLHEWVRPKAYGIAPMYEALVHIKGLISKWCNDTFNRRSFPPIVINITDGCCSNAIITRYLRKCGADVECIINDGKEHGAENLDLSLLEDIDVMIDVYYPDSVIAQRWNDVLAVRNDAYNGGYEFIAYQWYKNNEPIDGSVQNALGDFSDKLYSIHKDKLIPGSNKVIISRANFTDMNDKRMVRENYFITAPTSKDEDKILQALQDTNLFTGTIKENIKYGKLDATDEEVINAAKLANAHSFISMLPQGYDTMLTANGANLSQGEKQKLILLLALSSNLNHILLDEPLSGVDVRSEKQIIKEITTLTNNNTLLIVNSLSSIFILIASNSKANLVFSSHSTTLSNCINASI